MYIRLSNNVYIFVRPNVCVHVCYLTILESVNRFVLNL
jgi:hypothetical protein